MFQWTTTWATANVLASRRLSLGTLDIATEDQLVKLTHGMIFRTCCLFSVETNSSTSSLVKSGNSRKILSVSLVPWRMVDCKRRSRRLAKLPLGSFCKERRSLEFQVMKSVLLPMSPERLTRLPQNCLTVNQPEWHPSRQPATASTDYRQGFYSELN